MVCKGKQAKLSAALATLPQELKGEATLIRKLSQVFPRTGNPTLMTSPQSSQATNSALVKLIPPTEDRNLICHLK